MKGDETEIVPILFIGVVVIFLVLLSTFTSIEILPGLNIKDKIEKIGLLERMKSIANSFSASAGVAGEAYETLSKPASVEFISNSTGNYVTVDERTERVEATLKPGKVESAKINMFKPASGRVELRSV